MYIIINNYAFCCRIFEILTSKQVCFYTHSIIIIVIHYIIIYMKCYCCCELEMLLAKLRRQETNFNK